MSPLILSKIDFRNYFVESMQSSNNTSLQEASSYALWEIEGNELRYFPPTRLGASENPPPTYEETLLERPQDDGESPPPSYQEVIVGRQMAANKNKRCHVMLSYQESSKQCVRAIKERLVREGYKVWMDENNSSDIASMVKAGKAVEMAQVVLLCMSQKYKDSSNCRSEAAYSYKLKKHVIPLVVEDGYDPDGWLALMVGNEECYRFCTEYDVECNMPKLIRTIESGIGDQ
ncbi:uncharacterized protein [Amphiura filiformis]|uniref:uncharacterized protein n=1 Tax=Amphiura filiformis TaxID=82378 RepID=UPI003B20E97C